MMQPQTNTIGTFKLFVEEFPQLSEEQEAKLKKEVLALFGKAKWDTRKISKWMASPASGYGSYFTEEEAHNKILPWCRGYNSQMRVAYQQAVSKFRGIL